MLLQQFLGVEVVVVGPGRREEPVPRCFTGRRRRRFRPRAPAPAGGSASNAVFHFGESRQTRPRFASCALCFFNSDRGDSSLTVWPAAAKKSAPKPFRPCMAARRSPGLREGDGAGAGAGANASMSSGTASSSRGSVGIDDPGPDTGSSLWNNRSMAWTPFNA